MGVITCRVCVRRVCLTIDGCSSCCCLQTNNLKVLASKTGDPNCTKMYSKLVEREERRNEKVDNHFMLAAHTPSSTHTFVEHTK